MVFHGTAIIFLLIIFSIQSTTAVTCFEGKAPWADNIEEKCKKIPQTSTCEFCGIHSLKKGTSETYICNEKCKNFGNGDHILADGTVLSCCSQDYCNRGGTCEKVFHEKLNISIEGMKTSTAPAIENLLNGSATSSMVSLRNSDSSTTSTTDEHNTTTTLQPTTVTPHKDDDTQSCNGWLIFCILFTISVMALALFLIFLCLRRRGKLVFNDGRAVRMSALQNEVELNETGF